MRSKTPETLCWLLALCALSCTGRLSVGAPAPDGEAADASTPAPTQLVTPPAPAVRLTAAQYNRAVTDLFAPLKVPVMQFPAESSQGGFTNVAAAQTPSPLLIASYQTAAQTLAATAVAALPTFLPCATNGQAPIDGCISTFIGDFGSRAFRRPLTAEEKGRYGSFFAAARAQYGIPTALGLVVQVLLQSPHFLYRIEQADAVSDKQPLQKLSSHEMAARLALLFSGTLPDAPLRAAAAANQLQTADEVEAQVRRLLADPRTRTNFHDFFRQWLRFDKLDGLKKSTDPVIGFPQFNEQLAASLRDSLMQFVDAELWDNGSYDAFLSDPVAYVDGPLAAVYGVTAPSGSGLQKVSLDPTQRAGILTQAGVLAANAHETSDSPVLRGVFILDRLLCATPPPPPPGVNQSVPENTGTNALTTRQKFAQIHEQGTCVSCHRVIDGAGFGLEHYDALGQWRTTDNGLPVDSTSTLVGTGDADGAYDGAIELSAKLVQSRRAHDCLVQQLLQFSLGIGKNDIDASAVRPLGDEFKNRRYDFRELLVALARSDAFRYRAPPAGVTP